MLEGPAPHAVAPHPALSCRAMRTSGLTEERRALFAGLLSEGGMVQHRGDMTLCVDHVYGKPIRYYCQVYGQEGPVLCVMARSGGGFVKAHDGGGNPVWILAGAALSPEETLEVIMTFVSGETLPFPLRSAHVYWVASMEWCQWEGPTPEVCDPGGLALELDDTVIESLASSAVWSALTTVTISSPEWLAYATAHPLPSLQRLRISGEAGSAQIQAMLDAHPGVHLITPG